MRAWHGVATVLLALASACAPRGPILDTGSKPPDVGGTISGVVRASSGEAPLSGRKVAAIDVTTGARHETSTAVNGGYTIKLRRGRYRLEVELRAGERIVEQPPETEINASDLDAGRDFVIAMRPPGAAKLRATTTDRQSS